MTTETVMMLVMMGELYVEFYAAKATTSNNNNNKDDDGQKSPTRRG